MGRGRCGQRDVRCDREPPLTERLEIAGSVASLHRVSWRSGQTVFLQSRRSGDGAHPESGFPRVAGLGGLLFLFREPGSAVATNVRSPR